MVLFWCRTKQAQLRALSNQFKRCYYYIHESRSIIRETKTHAVNGQGLAFHRTRSDFGNSLRFFAAPVQAKPKYEDKDKGRPRMNEQIQGQYVRLVTDEGHSVVSRHEALDRARKLDLDLVEVDSDGNPPVCKLMDYKKEMYLKQVKEKEQTKKKSDVLRRGGLKEVRITYKIDKHDLKTKADTIKRLAERGHRIKCMAVTVPNENTENQDLGALLLRLSALVEDFTLVESGPMVEAKQAYVVVRHIKYGPLKKGPGKKNVSAMLNSNISTQSLDDQQSLNESDSETEGPLTEEPMELESTDEFDHNHTVKISPETSNRYAASRQTNNPSENRYATMRPTNGSGPGARRGVEPESQSENPNNRLFDMNKRGPGDGRFAPKLGYDSPRESGPVEVNRYKRAPNAQENTNMNPGGIRGQHAATFRR